ncbi:MAG: hypothetical protein J6A60_04470, partial [Clostridia bacterium]|nr:hypothetical protein [Clostridia bacterium]
MGAEFERARNIRVKPLDKERIFKDIFIKYLLIKTSARKELAELVAVVSVPCEAVADCGLPCRLPRSAAG